MLAKSLIQVVFPHRSTLVRRQAFYLRVYRPQDEGVYCWVCVIAFPCWRRRNDPKPRDRRWQSKRRSPCSNP
jgi:hypothetical protein